MNRLFDVVDVAACCFGLLIHVIGRAIGFFAAASVIHDVLVKRFTDIGGGLIDMAFGLRHRILDIFYFA